MRHTQAFIISLLMLCITLCSCYNDKSKVHDALPNPDPEANLKIGAEDSLLMKRQQDSLTFTSTHHYTNNYNFIVATDSMFLLKAQPEEAVAAMLLDSVTLYRDEQLVVAEIRILPTDSIDSVWVKVAHDQLTFGWIHESELLPNVVPDDPISQFIDVFSDTHLLWMLIIVGLIVCVYIMRIINRKGSKIVHINDIPSFYPTAFVLAISVAATVYATIQLFAPEMWRHFYYHPTLNPFSVPLLLGIFLTLVWLIPILGVAVIDDVRRHLPFEELALYLCGLVAVSMVDYIVFTVSTLYYIGYVLLAAYIYYAIRTFNRHRRLVYYCGRCGKAMHHKGTCPHCGALNE